MFNLTLVFPYNLANYRKNQSLLFETMFHRLLQLWTNCWTKNRSVAARKLRYFILSPFKICRCIPFSPHVYKVFIFQIFVFFFLSASQLVGGGVISNVLLFKLTTLAGGVFLSRRSSKHAVHHKILSHVYRCFWVYNRCSLPFVFKGLSFVFSSINS